ncbi:cyclic peptide export ABC transporter [Sedimentibacter sp. zth1]|uniref:cyclic peptide export ABC transporter n=1 Tax=Sedimentibacter sp. zth1 TaxID=2816908 RepID=UPI001A92DB4B|nr:cyclic peptide export ABC transporter [Sedimentibacter sp. zth1]QSX05655.1 cyclic peptide export ABC transporter [Sedimentibacter sp. zth1]
MEKYFGIGVVALCIIIGAIFTFQIMVALIDIFKRERKFKRGILSKLKTFACVGLYTLVGLATFYNIKQSDLNLYSKIKEYILVVFIIYCIFIVYYLITSWFTKKELRLFSVILVGLLGSLGYAFIMFIIDLVIQGNTKNYYIWYFIFAMVTYIYAQKITRSSIITFTNNKVCDFRKKLFDLVLNTSHEKLENTDVGRVYTCINNDMEILSSSMRDVVTVITNILTIVVCFIYLAILSLKCFIFAIIFVIVSFLLQLIYVRFQEKIFSLLMKIQHKVYNFLDSLIKGHKELAINSLKKKEFIGDVYEVNGQYMKTRISAENKMTNIFVLGQSLLYVVIGLVIFIFPIIFNDVDSQVLQSYALIFLFIISPVSYLVDLAPRAMQAKVSYFRIKEIISELQINANSINQIDIEYQHNVNKIELKNVTYAYKNNSDESSFKIGPINCDIESNKINFIIGSNGSGKSTLVKVITGLYEENEGEILINGKKALATERCELFSAIYSDYYLFKKLYGMNIEGKEAEIDYYLKQLRIDDKIKINNKELSTIELSSGQRKRIALLLCYLDNKDIYVFDEWAADQDIIFRDFFYKKLLPQMKEEGKTIIAITHDDRYFDIADNIICMDMGKLTEEKSIWKK